MSHLDEGTLHALLDGELELAEVREIQMHLGTCAACGSRLQDVKQFLTEADRLVGALETPGGAAGRAEPAAPREAAGPRELPPREPPPSRAFEPHNLENPPPLLLPDPLEGLAGRRRWSRGLKLAAMIALVVFGGRALSNTLQPDRPELQFNERDQATTTPAVVSPEETTRPSPPVATRQSRPAPAPAPVERPRRPAVSPPPPTLAEPDAEAKTLADASAADTALGRTDTAATVGSQDSATDGRVAAAAAGVAAGGAVAQDREEVDEETRRAAAAALAELDRERLESRANAATAALPPARSEVEAQAAPPPRTLEQRAQVYLRIGLDVAARQLGRPVHVIEAMTPEFIGLTQGRNVPGADASRPVVRVVYVDTRGRLIMLDQQRLRTGQAPGAPSGSMRWTLGEVMLYLHGEPAPDVLRNLQRRVR